MARRDRKKSRPSPKQPAKKGTPDTYDFPAREQSFNDNLGLMFGKFAVSMFEAHCVNADAYVTRIAKLAGAKNVDFQSNASIVGMKEKLGMDISVPLLAVADVKPLEIKEATMEMEMTTSSSASDTSSLSSKSSGGGRAKIGWGPVSVGIHMSASVSTSKEKSRKSDYRARTHAKLTMAPAEPPEGVSMLLDCIHNFTSSVMEMNKTKIGAESQLMLQDAQGSRPTSDTPAE